jgi:hypothetical protein
VTATKISLYLAGFLVLAGSALAQPQTPAVFLNEKIRLCELAVGQRATLRFDLRPIGGRRLKVNLYRHDQNRDEPPIREWTIDAVAGEQRLSFQELPRAVYKLVAYACDENGQALAYAAPVVHVEYGGWRAWEEFQPPIDKVVDPPTSFAEVDVATSIRNRNIQIAIDPPAVVVRPGGQVDLRAGFAGIEPERLKWTLVGDGKLKATDEYHYTYFAPAEQIGSKLVRVEIQSIAHPDLVGSTLILVTSADPETLNSPGP